MTVLLRALLLMCTLLTACHVEEPNSSLQVATTPPEVDPDLVPASPRFLPPEGKRVNVVGQNNDTIKDYVNAFNTEPGGVTGYLSISEVDSFSIYDSLNGTANWGSGNVDLSELVYLYPNSTLHLGLYLGEDLPDAAEGEYDQNILSLLNKLTEFDRPVFLRWGYEADGNGWNDYDPRLFKASWWRLFEILYGLRDVNGVFVNPDAKHHIALVFQVAASCFSTNTPDTADKYADHIEQWWPGSQFVDYFSVSYFAPHVCGNEYLDGAVAFAKRPDIDKPLMISESTPQGYMIGDDNSYGGSHYTDNWGNGTQKSPKTGEQIYQEWFQGYRDFIEEHNIRYVGYIADDWDKLPMWTEPYSNGFWGDARIWENPVMKQKWQEDMLDNPDVLNASEELFCQIDFRC